MPRSSRTCARRRALQELLEVLGDLTEAGPEPTALFPEADDETLMDRLKETRRRHPLAPNGRALEGIPAEREVLGPLREHADVVMDMSDLTGAMLRRRVVSEPRAEGRIGPAWRSTGDHLRFKNGRRAKAFCCSTSASC